MSKRRIYILTLGLLLVGGVVLGRLAQVQLAWHGRFDRERYTRAGGNRQIETVRGGIYTRWGTPLAEPVPSFDIGVHYDRLAQDDWKPVVARLSGEAVEALSERADGAVARVERIRRAVQRNTGIEWANLRVVEEDQYHCVAEGVSLQAAAAVRADPERFPGIRVLERTRRAHPNGDLAPHVVGLTNALSPDDWTRLRGEGRAWDMSMPLADARGRYRMDDRIGVSGIEKSYEDLLRGERGYVLNRLVFRMLSVDRETTEEPPEPGCSLFLTLREDFQRAANDALHWATTQPQLDFDRGALVIVDVQSGAILAAATYPSYDLAVYRDEFAELASDAASPLLFRPLQGALPTGSVFKTITALAALQTGAITPQTAYTCRHVERIAGRSFHCTGRHGSIQLEPAIEKSCNIYFYHAGLAAGGEALTHWARALGLGMPTDVDWPAERAGLVPVTNSTHSVVNLSIGQGRLLCTPVQVAIAMAAIANGGDVWRPHFLHHAEDAAGGVVERAEPTRRHVEIGRPVLDVVRRGMRAAVETGTARLAGLEFSRAAGKTGTAELGDTGLNHAWFAGFAPYEDARVAFAVVSERTTGHGGSHAAPIMARALEPVWQEVEAMR